MFYILYISFFVLLIYFINENKRNKLISKKYKILFNKIKNDTNHIVKTHEYDILQLKIHIYKLQDNKHRIIVFPVELGIIQINSTNQCINSIFPVFYNSDDTKVCINKKYLENYTSKYKKDSSYYNILLYCMFNNLKYMKNLKYLELDFKYIKQNHYSNENINTLNDFFDINIIVSLPIETLIIHNCNPKYCNIDNIHKLTKLKELQLTLMTDRNTNINSLYENIYNDISKINMKITKKEHVDFQYIIKASI